MAALSPYRSLPAAKRVELVLHDLSTTKDSRALYIQRMVARGGGFRPVTLRAWSLEKLAKEIVRLNLESFQDELGMLQTLYVEKEPELQIAFLDAAGVAHKAGHIADDMATAVRLRGQRARRPPSSSSRATATTASGTCGRSRSTMARRGRD